MRLISHRGASAHAPENTMAAFRLALEMGAKAVEFDVHQTRDHELVVLHDEDLKRVGKKALKVGALTYAELSRIDVGSWFDRGFAAERVPRLEEVMDLCQDRQELHVELKRGSRLYPGIEERVVDLLQRRGAVASSVVSSFDHEALYSVRSIDSNVRLGYLLGLTPWKTAWREMGEIHAESLNMSLRQASAASVKKAHESGLKVLVYTVNAAKDARKLAAWGVEGIFCNYPELSWT